MKTGIRKIPGCNMGAVNRLP